MPGVLTYALIEGLLLRGMVHGTGLALLEATQRMLAPVRVGDTIGAEATVVEVRPTAAGGRAVVVCEVRVTNQRGEPVLDYSVKRLLAGRPDEGTEGP